MRPITKPAVGTKVTDEHGKERQVQARYNPYSHAKKVMKAALGPYCNYCETYATGSDLQVDHIQPKATHPALEFDYSNFLLSCARCNGVDNKGTTDMVVKHALLPHIDDTGHAFYYEANGTVRPADGLNPAILARAITTIQVLGLYKGQDYAAQYPLDERYLKRREAYIRALRYRSFIVEQLNQGNTQLLNELVCNLGHFSIFYQLFQGYPEVQAALVASFNGTDPTRL